MARKQQDLCHPTVEELQREMLTVSEEIKAAYERFNWADDPDLVEASVYEINAAKARYNYLLRLTKARCAGEMQPVRAATVPGRSGICVAAAHLEGGDICPL